jgi:hypothetical protein
MAAAAPSALPAAREACTQLLAWGAGFSGFWGGAGEASIRLCKAPLPKEGGPA